MDPEKIMCAHKTCKCHCKADECVRFEGLLYCSQRCADDRGCDHEGCNCGQYPAEEPAANAT